MSTSTPAATGRGIPTATNIDHVAWTVADLDEAVTFFVDVLGGEQIFRAGPFADPEGDWMASHFDVHPRASTDIAMVRLGPTQVVELLAWKAPDGRSEWPRTSDAGATHLAVHVADMDAAIAYLVAHGCEPCGDVVLLADVPQAGIQLLYVRTPVGLYLELVSHPGSALPYERTTEVRLLPRAAAWSNR